MFPCERCGTCCRKISNVFFAKDMVLPNGVCKFLDENTNLCRIYSTRPIFCNVDAYYEKYLSQRMTREEFYEKNKSACLQLKTHIKDSDTVPIKKIVSTEEIPINLRAKLEG